MTTEEKIEYLEFRCWMSLSSPDHDILHSSWGDKLVFSGNWKAEVTFFDMRNDSLFEKYEYFESSTLPYLIDQIYSRQRQHEGVTP